METRKVASTTLWAALAFTWLAAAMPVTKDPDDRPSAASADRDGAPAEAPGRSAAT